MSDQVELADVWLSRGEAAEFLCTKGFKIAKSTLANLAAHDNSGKGPRFFRFGWRTIQYKKSDLVAWAESRVVRVE